MVGVVVLMNHSAEKLQQGERQLGQVRHREGTRCSSGHGKQAR